jgi:hypothetical protein
MRSRLIVVTHYPRRSSSRQVAVALSGCNFVPAKVAVKPFALGFTTAEHEFTSSLP